MSFIPNSAIDALEFVCGDGKNAALAPSSTLLFIVGFDLLEIVGSTIWIVLKVFRTKDLNDFFFKCVMYFKSCHYYCYILCIVKQTLDKTLLLTKLAVSYTHLTLPTIYSV